jgi:hypothetical protein
LASVTWSDLKSCAEITILAYEVFYCPLYCKSAAARA